MLNNVGRVGLKAWWFGPDSFVQLDFSCRGAGRYVRRMLVLDRCPSISEWAEQGESSTARHASFCFVSSRCLCLDSTIAE
jgi:hypothetical protein